jgi:hypothetical protein
MPGSGAKAVAPAKVVVKLAAKGSQQVPLGPPVGITVGNRDRPAVQRDVADAAVEWEDSTSEVDHQYSRDFNKATSGLPLGRPVLPRDASGLSVKETLHTRLGREGFTLKSKKGVVEKKGKSRASTHADLPLPPSFPRRVVVPPSRVQNRSTVIEMEDDDGESDTGLNQPGELVQPVVRPTIQHGCWGYITVPSAFGAPAYWTAHNGAAAVGYGDQPAVQYNQEWGHWWANGVNAEGESRGQVFVSSTPREGGLWVCRDGVMHWVPTMIPVQQHAMPTTAPMVTTSGHEASRGSEVDSIKPLSALAVPRTVPLETSVTVQPVAAKVPSAQKFVAPIVLPIRSNSGPPPQSSSSESEDESDHEARSEAPWGNVTIIPAFAPGENVEWLPMTVQVGEVAARNLISEEAFFRLATFTDFQLASWRFRQGVEPFLFAFRQQASGSVYNEFPVYLAPQLLSDFEMHTVQFRMWSEVAVADVTGSRERKRPAARDPSPTRSVRAAREPSPARSVIAQRESIPVGTTGVTRVEERNMALPLATVPVSRVGLFSARVSASNFPEPRPQPAKWVPVNGVALGDRQFTLVSLDMVGRLMPIMCLADAVLEGRRLFTVELDGVPRGSTEAWSCAIEVRVDVEGSIGDPEVDFLFNAVLSAKLEREFPDWLVTDEVEAARQPESRNTTSNGRGFGGSESGQPGVAPTSFKNEHQTRDMSEQETMWDSTATQYLGVNNDVSKLSFSAATGLTQEALSMAQEARLAQLMVFANTESTEQRSVFRKGFKLAVKLGIPMVMPNFASKRQYADNYQLDRCKPEHGCGNGGLSKPFLTRLCQRVVASLGNGLDLTPAEGSQCLYLFRRSLVDKTIADSFDNADMAGTIGMGMPGDWNRSMSWYLQRYNNVNVENALVDKAKLNYQLQGQSIDDWVSKMEMMVQAISVPKRDSMIAPVLGALLRPGWLQNEMQRYRSDILEGDEEVTFAAYMRKLAHKSASDPGLLSRPRQFLDNKPEKVSRLFRPPRAAEAAPGIRAGFIQTRVKARVSAVSVGPADAGTAAPVICNQCHQPGHVAFKCPQRAAGRGRGQPAGRGALAGQVGGAVRPGEGRGRGSG